jgi:hypothetical protein
MTAEAALIVQVSLFIPEGLRFPLHCDGIQNG